MARERNPDGVGYVYMIRPRCHHKKDLVVPYKIGWTKNDPELRLLQFQQANWYSLEVYAYYGKGLHANEVERDIHNELRKKQKAAEGGNEWFHLTLADVRRIEKRLDRWNSWLGGIW